MRSLSKVCIAVVLLCLPVSLFAQKDSLRLVCPFEHGLEKEPKEAYVLEPREEKIIMVSNVDTLLRSCITGKVTNVSPTEDSNFEIVIHYKNFYFWYYGVANPLVKKGQNVVAGQSIGNYVSGTEIEFRMFKFEEPVNARNLLDCKVPAAKD